MTRSTGGYRPPTGFYIWRLSLAWRSAVDRTLAPLGLTHIQYSTISSLSALIASGATPSQRALADFNGLEPMYVSKVVRACEQAGLLTRVQSRRDPRAFELALTDFGKQRVAEARLLVAQLQEQMLAPLGPSDAPRRKEFAETLHLLLDHAEDLGIATAED